MTDKVLHTTESVCPECIQRIAAEIIENDDTILMVKQCPEHGEFRTVIWRGTPRFDAWSRPKIPYSPDSVTRAAKGCPYDCGLCEHHSQRTCTALVEITSRCNLHCPVCFADSGKESAEPSLDRLEAMFNDIFKRTGGCNLQLSGGEPTMREDLPEIVSVARKAGFTFIQLNTNGLRLARDPDLSKRLKAAGLSSVFLQFDSVTDGPYREIRGRELFRQKQQAIANLGKSGIGIVLVPTVVPGINDRELWDIIRFGLARQPHVRGVHFQPVSYFGRFPKQFLPHHVTLPEVMNKVSLQSGGVINEGDFTPPGCEHELCSFSARYLVREDSTLTLLGNSSCDCTPQPAEEGALRSIDVTARQWGGVPTSQENIEGEDDLSRFLRRARSHTFSISGMAFQDCWNLDINRLRGCCIHVAQQDGRLIPFCSYNLTARDGSSLHRPHPDSNNESP